MCVYSTEGKSNPLGVTSSQAWWCSVKCIGCGPMLRVGNPQHSPKHRQGWHVVWVSGKEGCGTCVIWVRSWEVACLA